MNIDDTNKFQLIDDYLNGGLSQDDADKFKAFMQSDRDLALDVNIVEELNESVRFGAAENELRNTLGSIRTEDTNRGFNIVKPLFIAFLLGALLFTLFKFFGPAIDQPTQRNTVYQQYAMVEDLSLTTKSLDVDPNVRKLETAYNNQNYLEALPIIDNLLKVKPNDLDILLAKGIALMKTDQDEAALNVFQFITTLGPRVNKQNWYQALIYCKQGEKEKAKAVLNDIISTNDYNSAKAKEIIAKL